MIDVPRLPKVCACHRGAQVCRDLKLVRVVELQALGTESEVWGVT